MSAGSAPLVVGAGVAFAALAPLLLIGLAFLVFCLVDLVRAPSVRYLPKWVWALICFVSVPLGGIIYLLVGRGDRR